MCCSNGMVLMGDEETKEYIDKLISTLEGWKDEIKDVVVDYNKDTKTLEAAMKVVESQQKKWWVVYRPYILVFAAFIIGIVVVIVLTRDPKFCGTVTVPNGYSYSKPCPSV